MREIITKDGIRRFKENRIVCWCLDNTTDMNQISQMCDRDFFTLDELKEFYQIIGYSIGGYEEIFEDETVEDEEANKVVEAGE